MEQEAFCCSVRLPDAPHSGIHFTSSARQALMNSGPLTTSEAVNRPDSDNSNLLPNYLEETQYSSSTEPMISHSELNPVHCMFQEIK